MRQQDTIMVDTFPAVLAIPHIPVVADGIAREEEDEEADNRPNERYRQNYIRCNAQAAIREDVEVQAEHGDLDCGNADAVHFLLDEEQFEDLPDVVEGDCPHVFP